MTAVAIKVASDVAARRRLRPDVAADRDARPRSFDGDVRRAQAIARDLGAAVEADSTRDRARGAAVVKQFAVSHPTCSAPGSPIEPNAFGRRRRRNVSRGLLGDNDGRFAVWAERLKGTLNVTAFENPAGQAVGRATTTTRCRSKGFDGMLEPYLDSGAMMTSYVTPIKRGGKRVGVAGVDLALQDLDARVKARQGARHRLRVRGVRHGPARRLPAAAGLGGQEDGRADRAHSATSPGLAGDPGRRQGRRAGHVETVDPVTGKPAVLFYAPVKTGGWSFVAVAPKAEVLAGVNSLRTTLILVGLLALLLVIAGLLAFDRGPHQPPGARGGRRPPSGSPRATST